MLSCQEARDEICRDKDLLGRFVAGNLRFQSILAFHFGRKALDLNLRNSMHRFLNNINKTKESAIKQLNNLSDDGWNLPKQHTSINAQNFKKVLKDELIDVLGSNHRYEEVKENQYLDELTAMGMYLWDFAIKGPSMNYPNYGQRVVELKKQCSRTDVKRWTTEFIGTRRDIHPGNYHLRADLA
jgi:hypothetical protein